MRTLYILLSCLFFLPKVQAQDSLFYNSDLVRLVSTLDSADIFRIAFRDENDSNKVHLKSYYKEGQMLSESNYSDFAEGQRHGIQKEWHKNGNLKLISEYNYGTLSGDFISYWKSGQVKRKDLYLSGDLVSGTCFDEYGRSVPYYSYTILPIFPKNVSLYMSKNIKYPKNSKKNKISGRVIVRFMVRKNGSVDKIEITQSVNEELDNEVIRVIKKMPKWKPGIIDGEYENVYFSLPVAFNVD